MENLTGITKKIVTPMVTEFLLQTYNRYKNGNYI